VCFAPLVATFPPLLLNFCILGAMAMNIPGYSRTVSYTGEKVIVLENKQCLSFPLPLHHAKPQKKMKVTFGISLFFISFKRRSTFIRFLSASSTMTRLSLTPWLIDTRVFEFSIYIYVDFFEDNYVIIIIIKIYYHFAIILSFYDS
jgi:hypothetical protein